MSKSISSRWKLKSAESVTEGHPDKLCDQISDLILDEALSGDPGSAVAIETTAAAGLLLVAGEMTTGSWVDIQTLARKKIVEIGYEHPEKGFDGNSCAILNVISPQAQEIRSQVFGSTPDVPDAEEIKAGDQGIVIGYASSETENRMPLQTQLATRLARRLAEARHSGEVEWLRPDGKTQITLGYDPEPYIPGQPLPQVRSVERVVLSTQHHPDVDPHEDTHIKAEIFSRIIAPVLQEGLASYGVEVPEFSGRNDRVYAINANGRFTAGGPGADTGLTGRKNVVDCYGPVCAHGGGAFSGKDPSKVDRSGSYGARWVAKHIVDVGLAHRAQVQVTYLIGQAEPIGVEVETWGTHMGLCDGESLREVVRNIFGPLLAPQNIINRFGLRKFQYLQTSAYGHFGRPEFPWEQVDPALINMLRERLA